MLRRSVLTYGPIVTPLTGVRPFSVTKDMKCSQRRFTCERTCQVLDIWSSLRAASTFRCG